MDDIAKEYDVIVLGTGTFRAASRFPQLRSPASSGTGGGGKLYRATTFAD